VTVPSWLHVFVSVEHDAALLLHDFQRQDFILELAGFLRGFRFQLRLQRELVLLGARDLVFLGHVFGRGAHVVLVVDVPQAVHDHRVDRLEVAHAEAVARTVDDVRRGAHVFLAAGDDDLGVACLQRLRRQVGGFQAGAADMVDGEAGNGIRQARLDDRLARRVLADAGSQHLAEDGFADQVRIDAGFGQQALDHMCTQLGRRDLGQAAAEFTHTSTASGHDNYIIHLILHCTGRNRLS